MNVLKGIGAALVAVAGVVNIVAYSGDSFIADPSDDEIPYVSGQEPDSTGVPDGTATDPGYTYGRISTGATPTNPDISTSAPEEGTTAATEPPAPPLPTETWLTDLSLLYSSDTSYRVEEGDVVEGTLFGDETVFQRRISAANGIYGTYYLRGMYSKLEGTWNSERAATVEIYADDVMVYTATSSGGEEITLSVDIRNCTILKVLVTGARATILNPLLLPNPNFVPSESVFNITGMSRWLVDIEPHRGSLFITKSPGTSNTGETFSNSIHGGAGHNTDWRLDRQYTRLKGVFTVIHTSGPAQSVVTLRILSNDEEIYTVELRRGELPVTVDLDITGCEKLTIVIDSHGGSFDRLIAHFANAALFE